MAEQCVLWNLDQLVAVACTLLQCYTLPIFLCLSFLFIYICNGNNLSNLGAGD